MSFQILAYCKGCNKRKLYISHREYTVPYISSKPITSKEMLCGKCIKIIKKATLK